jgi:hypothetical protein
VFRGLLPPALCARLLDEATGFGEDPPVPGPFPSHGSPGMGCACPLCGPRVLSSRPSRGALHACLENALRAVGGPPDDHCINVLPAGACHLHHVDGVETWYKAIVLLKSADEGGVFAVGPRCAPCGCLADERCPATQCAPVHLKEGDAVALPVGRLCHGVSRVIAGERVTWVLRYDACPAGPTG